MTVQGLAKGSQNDGMSFIPGAQALARCDAFGVPPYSEHEGQLVRRFLTSAHAAALRQLEVWMKAAGMTVRLDAAANLIGRYEGLKTDAPALMIGSHIDTVRNGGRYDGALGVMLGIDCVEALAKAGRRLSFAVEVIAFGDEEGSRFPISMTCSRAVAGAADPKVLQMQDADGVSLSEALSAFGLKDASPRDAAREANALIGFLEAHIEQGPVLEAEDLPLGVVSAIASQKRFRVRYIGLAGHAGTTPMSLRRDPAPAAAEAILAVERVCGGGIGGLVGTVGQISARPGAVNVIPGSVELSLDLRAETAKVRDEAEVRLTEALKAIAEKRGLSVEIELVQELAETPCDSFLASVLETAVRAVGVRPRRMPSGAAHDAMTMGALCPWAMLFIRCKGGISHNPLESVREDDCVLAASAMMIFIENLDVALAA